jgi:predicted nucleic acid-binding protein
MADPLPIYYLDASALVKRYVIEQGTSWIVALSQPATGNTLATARITKAEAAAAIASKYRNGGLSRTDYENVLLDLEHDFAHEYLVVEIDEALVDLAVALTRRCKLRGYDAVQLAAGLTINDILVQAQLPNLTFIASDNDLLNAARNEGMDTDDPNRHLSV